MTQGPSTTRRFVSPIVVLLAAFVAGCASSPAASARVEGFSVDAPSTGSVVSSSPITVSGRAPAGARIVQDISFAPDQDVIAGTDGAWSMQVELEEGANELTFRVGDDASTAITIGITYRPSAAATDGPPTPDPTEEPPPAQPTGEPSPAEPTPAPTPTPEPTPEPTEAPSFATFSDGTWEVGADIVYSTYRLREPASFCYWARLSGFGGGIEDIIANENVIDAYAIVSIGKNDVGFESNGCGEWTTDLSPVTSSTSSIDVDGTYMVGRDISAGKWRSTGGEFCYWARLKGFGGTINDIIANDNVFDGPTIVTIASSDKGFVTRGCGTWSRS